MAEWQRAIAIGEVTEGAITPATVGELRIVLLRAGDAVVAYKDRCAHQGYPLSRGKLFEGVLLCPRHNWEYDVATGQCVMPRHRREECLTAYKTRVADGFVEIELDAPG